MIFLGIVVAVLWILTIAFLCIPTGFWSNSWDSLTRARWRDDRVGLQIMIDHLRSFPEQWSVSRNGASFPKEGAKQIYITQRDKNWEYSLTNFGGESRQLAGHFGKQFVQAITDRSNDLEKEALMRRFYPELSGTLLLK